jgi:hypothetical protein
VDLSGAAIKQDKDETVVLYKRFVLFSDILSGKVTPPKEAQPLLAALEKYAPDRSHSGGRLVVRVSKLPPEYIPEASEIEEGVVGGEHLFIANRQRERVSVVLDLCHAGTGAYFPSTTHEQDRSAYCHPLQIS